MTVYHRAGILGLIHLNINTKLCYSVLIEWGQYSSFADKRLALFALLLASKASGLDSSLRHVSLHEARARSKERVRHSHPVTLSPELPTSETPNVLHSPKPRTPEPLNPKHECPSQGPGGAGLHGLGPFQARRSGHGSFSKIRFLFFSPNNSTY